MNNKLYLSLFCALLYLPAGAQLSQGGYPVSFSNPEAQVKTTTLPYPDYTRMQEEEQPTGPYLVASLVPADIRFPESGYISRTNNGCYIWSVKVELPDASGTGFYYDKFRLPDGVSLYLYNHNHRQILGAYTAANNSRDGKFATEPVQGTTVYLELNIDKDAAIDDIQLHINEAAAYYRGVDYLNYYAASSAGTMKITASATDSSRFGRSSVCQINAVCPQGYGYETQRQSTVSIMQKVPGGVGFCSATMVNNTGNTASSCKAYLLTASHCESSGSMADSTFSTTIVRFNYEQNTCTWDPAAIPTAKTLVGLRFLSRSYRYDGMSLGSMKGDFLLLEMKNIIPMDWNATLNGWNRTPGIIGIGKFRGFHHPAGDIKVVSTSTGIISDGFADPDTHWSTELGDGYSQGGSSGSSLFDKDGYTIGMLTGSSESSIPPSCQVSRKGAAIRVGDVVLYSKLSYCWENPGDGAGLSDNQMLKPWLDPAKTGALTLAPTTSDCSGSPTTSMPETSQGFSGHLNAYPNPSSSGIFHIGIQVSDPENLQLDVYDISGKIVFHSPLPEYKTQTTDADLSALPQGLYLLRVSAASGTMTMKINSRN